MIAYKQACEGACAFKTGTYNMKSAWVFWLKIKQKVIPKTVKSVVGSCASGIRVRKWNKLCSLITLNIIMHVRKHLAI